MPTLERDMRDKEFTFPAGAEVNIIPVMQVEGLNKIDEASLPDILPVLALRNAVVFPGAVFPITIGSLPFASLAAIMPSFVRISRDIVPSIFS